MSFLVNWIFDVLGYLGILANKSAKIVFLGLDNAGKSTLLKVLKDGCVSQTDITYYPQSDTVSVGKLQLQTFDLGGHEMVRQLWRDYFGIVDAIVFVVDSTDTERFCIAAQELQEIIRDAPEIPIVILGNKIDKPGAVSDEALYAALGLGLKDKMQLFMCSVWNKVGYEEAFRWLSNTL